MVVTVTGRTDRSQRVSLIHKEDTTHRLVAKPVYHLRGLSLIGTDHLGTVDFYHMTTVQITDGSQNLTQLTGNGGLTCTRITCQDDMHRHLLLLTQSTLLTLNGILYGVCYLTDGTLHLAHADEVVEILEYVLNRTLLRHITLNV